MESIQFDVLQKAVSKWPYPATVKSSVLEVARVLDERGAPILLDFGQVADFLNISLSSLADMVHRQAGFYTQFTLPKTSGGERTISVPKPSLMSAQRSILDGIFGCEDFHPSCHGYVKGRSIISNAEAHIGSSHMIKMDMKNFFPSITLRRIIGVFRKIGYPSNISFYLARLCCYLDILPQGAPTSPCLSNIVATSLDHRLSGLAKKIGANYTRYADDITLSGSHLGIETAKLVELIVQDEGFSVNKQKTHIIRKNSRKIVSGLQVGDRHVRTKKSYRRELRKLFYYIEKYGIEEHELHTGRFDPLWIEKLTGKVSFLIAVEGKSAESEKYMSIIRNSIRKFEERYEQQLAATH